MSSLAWLGCILLMVALVTVDANRFGEPRGDSPSWKQLGWEFLLVYVFVNHGPALFVLRTALNHSLSTLFGLLAAWFLLRGVRQPETSNRNAFWAEPASRRPAWCGSTSPAWPWCCWCAG